MSNYIKFALVALIPAALLFGCDTKPSSNGTDGTDTSRVDSNSKAQSNALRLSIVDDSPIYIDPKITVISPKEGKTINEGEFEFEFGVENFKLGVQTDDAATKGFANSDKGQHIHFFLNNGPYMAHYEPKAKVDLKEGHYVLLAFLSRSYHESVKDKSAYALSQFNVGKPGDEESSVDLKAPHMFYSRPKGKYVGPGETDKLLLDFYLVNCTLSPDGYKVRATINGQEFLLTKWAAYLIEGLPLGEVKIKLELLDKDNQLVSSPFNPVERSVTLEAAPSQP